MKVGLITDSYPPNIGGAEIAVQKIAEGISERNNEVIVITSGVKDNFPFHSKLKENSVVRIKVPHYIQRFWFLVFSLFVILKKCKDADILHGTSYGGVLQTFIASRILNKPAIVTIHEFMGKKWNSFAPNFLSAYFFRIAEKIYTILPFDRFIAVSNYTKNCLVQAGIQEEKITVIHNGGSELDLSGLNEKSTIRKKLNISEDKFVYAMFGRTGLTKGFEYAVDAIPSVLKKIPSAFFLLILSPGDKKIYRRITKKAAEIKSDRVQLYSSLERADLLDYINTSDAVIIPSLSEGFGFTTLEACMMNKIVIASSAGSIPEVIYGKNILVKPGSAEEIVEGCVKAFSGNYDEKGKINFNWGEAVNKYIKVYQEVLNYSIK